MHCPRCGQEQVSGNLKFCSKCGLPLGWVAEIIRNGGELPEIAKSSGSKLFTRANGLKLSIVWFLVLDFLMVPLIAILGGEEEVALLAVMGFMGAVLIAVFSMMFLKNPPKSQLGVQANERPGVVGIPAGVERNTLPAGQQQPANEYAAPGAWQAPDTGELVKPASVTEGTTRLLNKDKKL
jgi:hypothetical protein